MLDLDESLQYLKNSASVIFFREKLETHEKNSLIERKYWCFNYIST